MKKFWSRFIIISLLLVASLISTDYVSAQLNNDVLEQTKLGDSLGGSGIDLGAFIGMVVKTILGFLGAVFTILIIWAGAQWMTAGGDEKKVETAKLTLRNSIIGLIIIICAYAISTFTFNLVGEWLKGGSANSPSSTVPAPNR